MWQVVTVAPNIEEAYAQLLSEFDVEAELFAQNFSKLLGRLVDLGLLESIVLMLEQIRRFKALERPEQELFLRAYSLLPLISISLRWRGFRKTKASLERFLPVTYGPQNHDAEKRACQTEQLVRSAAQHGIGHPSCLEISLALWWLLARQGIASDLRVGVRKDGETFEAHAWVECGGATIDETEATHHHSAAFDKALASLPPEPQ